MARSLVAIAILDHPEPGASALIFRKNDHLGRWGINADQQCLLRHLTRTLHPTADQVAAHFYAQCSILELQRLHFGEKGRAMRVSEVMTRRVISV
jgi:hypothetical protein